MPEPTQLYSKVEQGRTTRAVPTETASASSAGQISFALNYPRPAVVIPTEIRGENQGEK